VAQHKLLSTHIDADDSIKRNFRIDETAYKKLAVLAKTKQARRKQSQNPCARKLSPSLMVERNAKIKTRKKAKTTSAWDANALVLLPVLLAWCCGR
jgi:hypothetical protein